MWEDPIIKEIHKFREEHAKKFNFDLRAIFLDLKEQEKRDKRRKERLTGYRDEIRQR